MGQSLKYYTIYPNLFSKVLIKSKKFHESPSIFLKKQAVSAIFNKYDTSELKEIASTIFITITQTDNERG